MQGMNLLFYCKSYIDIFLNNFKGLFGKMSEI